MSQAPFNFSFPIVDNAGFATLAFQQWVNQASLSIPIIGSGSPEGVVDAQQYKLYLDTSADAGSIAYRKMLPSIGGDTSMGWELQ